MAEATLGGELIRGLVQRPVLMGDAAGGGLLPVQVRLDPGDSGQFMPLGKNPHPQVAVLQTAEGEAL